MPWPPVDDQETTITLSEADTALWQDASEVGERFRGEVRARAERECKLWGAVLQIRSYRGLVLETVGPCDDEAVVDARRRKN